MVCPGVAKETLSHAHAGEDEVTGTKPIYEDNEDTEEERKTLGILS